MNKILNVKYTLLHGFIGMLCTVAFGYNVFYLTEYGFDSGQTGLIIALSNGITAVCLPIFGRLADRSKVFHWKTMLKIFASLSILVWSTLLFCDYKPVVCILFQFGGLLTSCMYPMANAVCFYYEKRGIIVDYGIARGTNSLLYGIGAFILGQLTVKMGTFVVAIMGLAISIALFGPILTMPYMKDEIAQQAETEKKKNAAEKKKEEKFWKKYPAFSVMVVGSALLMTVFNLTGTFLIRIIENVGGDSSHLGVALAICAISEVPILMLFSHIVKRIPETKLLIVSGIMYCAKCLVLFFAGSVWMVYAAQLLQPFSYALFASASVYFSDKCMEEEDAVTGQSLLSMCGSIGSVIGSLLGGWLVEASGVSMTLIAGIVLALLTTIVIVISVRMYLKECRMKVQLAGGEMPVG